jgi:hypothetical protein
MDIPNLQELVVGRIYDGEENTQKLLKMLFQKHGLYNLLEEGLDYDEKVKLIKDLHSELPSSFVQYLHYKSSESIICNLCGMMKDICRICDGIFCGKDCSKNGGIELISRDLERTSIIIKICNYCYIDRGLKIEIDRCLNCKISMIGDTILCSNHSDSICATKETIFCRTCDKSFEGYVAFKKHICSNEY